MEYTCSKFPRSKMIERLLHGARFAPNGGDANSIWLFFRLSTGINPPK
jgi:hypothetical protein